MTKLIQRAKISPSSSKSKTMICSFSSQWKKTAIHQFPFFISTW
jgi:hypothetical protein